ncbi:MAG: NifB/NifX family molybdenum-iron cluster-binding protein [Desulfuromonadaceae bacterium]|nr:NifB/NifX family molybdenum-iron cluster-binding protein [Desulfuromonadaceae bacterium]
MKIAIPTANNLLAMHFGHCEIFTLITVNPENQVILGTETVQAPPHEPGLLPRWLAEKDVTLVIAGGMGQRAQMLFADQGIQVVVGAPAQSPEALVKSYLGGTLLSGINLCDH